MVNITSIFWKHASSPKPIVGVPYLIMKGETNMFKASLYDVCDDGTGMTVKDTFSFARYLQPSLIFDMVAAYKGPHIDL